MRCVGETDDPAGGGQRVSDLHSQADLRLAAEIREGESATVTVATSNGVRFAEDQRIALSVSGTASATDYTGVPATLTLPAYGTSTTATLTITASHGGAEIGSATVTVAASAETAPSGAGFPLAPENSRPSGIWSDGQTAWVADLDDARLYAYQRADGERQPDRDIATAPAPMGLWSDGETLWVADWRERMYAYRLSDGGRDPRRDIEAGAGDTDPTGLWSGSGTLLSTGWVGGQVRAYRLPEAAEGATGKQPASGPLARAVTLPAIADPALKDAIAAALGKAPGEAVSPQELAGLEALMARNAGIRDLSGLEQAVSLKELDIGFNPLADLRPLAALLALESLNLDGAVTDLRELAPLARLQHLSLRHNGLDDLRPLAGLASLAELDVDRNRIADLWPLASLAGLEMLDLSTNRVRDLQPLAGMARLKALRLDSNGLTEVHPLAGLESLRELGLAANAVDDLRGLSNLAGLRRLDLRGNAVEDLRPLRALPSLVWVHVGGSRIGDLAPLDGLPGLTVAGGEDREPPTVAGEAGSATSRQ